MLNHQISHLSIVEPLNHYHVGLHIQPKLPTMGKRKRTTGHTNQLSAKEKGIPRNLKPNQIKRQCLGSEESRLSAYTTRSGRKVVKPVAAWRGERALYDQRSLDAGTLVLS